MSASSDLRFPSIEGLRAFEAAARLASFERAADELAVTASAVGKRISTVEELIGAQLFARGGKALALTATGREYLEHVRAALALLAGIPQHQRAMQRQRGLRICSPPTFARQVLVPLLPEFTAAHPDVEVELMLSIPFIASPSMDADIDIRHGDMAALGGTVLMDDVITPLIAPALLKQGPALRVPADLAHTRLLRTPIEPWTTWFQAAGLAWPEPSGGTKFVDLGLTLEAAVAGQGVVLGRPSLARRWLQRGELQALFTLTARPAHRYGLMPHAADAASAAFAQWLRERCAAWAAQSLELLSARA